MRGKWPQRPADKPCERGAAGTNSLVALSSRNKAGHTGFQKPRPPGNLKETQQPRGEPEPCGNGGPQGKESVQAWAGGRRVNPPGRV